MNDNRVCLLFILIVVLPWSLNNWVFSCRSIWVKRGRIVNVDILEMLQIRFSWVLWQPWSCSLVYDSSIFNRLLYVDLNPVLWWWSYRLMTWLILLSSISSISVMDWGIWVPVWPCISLVDKTISDSNLSVCSAIWKPLSCRS